MISNFVKIGSFLHMVF